MNIHTKRFIFSALIYFFVGCSLGFVSILWPNLIPAIRPIHSHINLLGWVSMMIIGVTYFVIPLFVKREPFSNFFFTLHFVTANLGIVGMTVAFTNWNMKLLVVSAIVEAFSSYLYLFNIVSTAVKGTPSSPRNASVGQFLMEKADDTTDKWATFFTQVSTTYFIIGSTLGAYMTIYPGSLSYFRVHFHVTLLGWVTMMIYGVAYHIFPRFSNALVRYVPLVRANFILANIGLVFMTASLIYAEKTGNSKLSGWAIGLSGIIEATAGIIFIYNIFPTVTKSLQKMGRASILFVRSSLFYLLTGTILGLSLAFQPNLAIKLMPVHAHVNVLGWITMMMFGVGLYIIPKFSGKELYSHKIAMLQFWIANIGLVGLLILMPFRTDAFQWTISLFAGLELIASLLFFYNILKSIR